MDRPLPQWIRFAAIAGAGLAILWLESRRPLRSYKEPRLRHTARNAAMAGIGAATIAALEAPVVERLSARVHRERLGLLKRLRLPGWLDLAAAVVLLDYTLYIWHYFTHRVPFLWRFHKVHHVDLDMDASTGLRFHFGELALSTFWRVLQVRVIGVSPRALSIWQTLTILSIMFHHSDLELPEKWERRLGRFIVTPGMHTVHHSRRFEERESNWSSGLTIWDWLHGTLRRRPDLKRVQIGVPGVERPEQVTLPKLVVMPARGTSLQPGFRRGGKA